MCSGKQRSRVQRQQRRQWRRIRSQKELDRLDRQTIRQLLWPKSPTACWPEWRCSQRNNSRRPSLPKKRCGSRVSKCCRWQLCIQSKPLRRIRAEKNRLVFLWNTNNSRSSVFLVCLGSNLPVSRSVVFRILGFKRST